MFTKFSTFFIFAALIFNFSFLLSEGDVIALDNITPANAHNFLPFSAQNKLLNMKAMFSISSLLDPVEASSSALTAGDCPQVASSSAVDKSGDSTDLLQTINESSALPSNHVPKNLVDISPEIKTFDNDTVCMESAAAAALIKMSKAMTADGLTLVAVSGYRSYQEQKSLYDSYAPTMNSGAYHRVAPAGHSEHQLGTAVDVAGEFKSGVNFEGTKESAWLRQHANDYGFLLSYEKGEEQKTGYMYEPWHLRYVGKDNAKVLTVANYSLAFKAEYFQQSWLSKLFTSLKKQIGGYDIPIGG